jgi:hypothetical protein
MKLNGGTHMKKKLIFYISLILMTVLLVKAAYIMRGYFAIGGEWFVWVIPVLIQIAKSKKKPIRRDLEGKKIYIAGKITGYRHYRKKFIKAEKELKERGAIVMNPAALPPRGFTHDQYMHICFSMIDVCEAVFFLENWPESPGAMKEFNYSKVKRKEILYQGI